MADQVLRFDILSTDRASSGFSAAGKSASDAAGKVDGLSRRLEEVSRKSVNARVGLKGNAEALAELDRTDAKLLGLDRRVASPHLKVEGAARAMADISALNLALDKLGSKTSTPGAFGRFTGTLARMNPLSPGGGAAAGGGSGGAGLAALLPAASGAVNPYTIAAGAAVAPFAGQMAAGGIIAGFGAALAGLAVLGASKTKSVEASFASLKTHASADLGQISKSFVPVMSSILGTAQTTLGKLTPVFAGAERVIAGPFRQFGNTLITSFNQPAVRTSIDAIAVAFGKLLKALTPQLPGMIKSLADGITRVAKSVSANPKAFADFVSFLFKAAGAALTTIAWLTRVASYIEAHFGPAMHRVAVVFDGVRHDIAHTWDQIWNNSIGMVIRLGHDVERDFNDFRHRTAVIFDGARHDIAHVWDQIFSNSIGSVIRIGHNVETQFNSLRHGIAGTFDGIRHDISHAWDLTWNNTIGRLERGRHDTAVRFDGLRHDTAGKWDGIRHDTAASWNSNWNATISRLDRGRHDIAVRFDAIRHDIAFKFDHAGQWLVGKGHDIIQGLWNGITAIWGKVEGWFTGLPSKILHALGIHSPPKWAIDAGGHIMSGILKGLAHGGDIESFFMGKVSSVFSLVKDAGSSIWHALFGGGGGPAGSAGGGVQRWRSTVLQALGMEGLPASLAGDVLYQLQTESAGNQYAINNTDSNAAIGQNSRGLLQVIPATFAAYHVAGTSWDIYNPLANIAAAISYSAHGRGFGSGPGQMGSGHGYALGTMSAAPGWGWVGERGPELMHFRGGEQVVPAGAARGGGTGNTYHIHVHADVSTDGGQIGGKIIERIRQFERRSGHGWRK